MFNSAHLFFVRSRFENNPFSIMTIMKNFLKTVWIVILVSWCVSNNNLCNGQKNSEFGFGENFQQGDNPEKKPILDKVADSYNLNGDDEVSLFWSKLRKDQSLNIASQFKENQDNYDLEIFELFRGSFPELVIEQRIINAAHNKLKPSNIMSEAEKKFEMSVQQLLSRHPGEFIAFENERNSLVSRRVEKPRNMSEKKEHGTNIQNSTMLNEEINKFAISKGLDGVILDSNAYKKFQISTRISSFSKENNNSRFLPINEDKKITE